MQMHPVKFKDRLIARAEPVVVLTPVIEETLRLAGVAIPREQIIDRFMRGAPRIAAVHGGDDHPPSLGSRETIRRLTRQIWAQGGLPFEVSQSFPCEELAQGSDSAHYAFLSRNVCAAALSTHLEQHSYDGAIVLGVCDKMMVGNLRALIEADLSRQRRKARPLFAMLIPPHVGKEAAIGDDDKRKFEALKNRLPEPERRYLDEQLHRPLTPRLYGDLKAFMDRCFHRRLIAEGERDEFERALARCTSVAGANCAASQSSVVHRLMLSSFGLVPRNLDISLRCPSDEQLGETAKRLISAISKRERRVSVASLVRSNLTNAFSVWSATGGQPVWLLHLAYLGDAIGKKYTTTDMTRKVASVPQIFAMNGTGGHTAYTMALEKETGGNSGIDTLMRTLAEKRLIEDRSATFDGPWGHRIMEARSANGNFVYSTMTPYALTCGSLGLQGNVCSSAIAHVGVQGNRKERFDQKIYLVAYFLGLKDFLSASDSAEGVLDRLRHKVSREDLYYTWLLNWPDTTAKSPDIENWTKNKLWDFLVAQNLLRAMVVVAGIGPHAAGMPQLQLACPAMPNLDSVAVLVTDGRVEFQHGGISIEHVAPEAFDGGALLAVRTGDWIHLNLAQKEIQVVAQARGPRGYKVLTSKELFQRPDSNKRISDLKKRRMEFMPSVRILLDQVSSAEAGVSPKA